MHTATLDTRLTGDVDEQIHELITDFVETCHPANPLPLLGMIDQATGAFFIEAHLRASDLVPAATTDVPLDPSEQSEYRANREIVEDHVAFKKMREDARSSRAFSNIVCEFTRDFDESHPVKIIGGQHRFNAISEALQLGVDELHGLKLYVNLDSEQRLDVQLISNTNIAVSTDLFDRMTETLAGPQLRNWCQACGLLDQGEDFADKRLRGNPITVRAARAFIINYFEGRKVSVEAFDRVDTTPTLPKSGVQLDDWEALKREHPELWNDQNLLKCGSEFAELNRTQRDAFTTPKGKISPGSSDSADKALNYAILSSWAFVAGVLSHNPTRQNRLFGLRSEGGKDPLNAAALAKGRHKTDPENYRGLGYRTDAKERGRLAELFFLQAEEGGRISASTIDLAIKKYHAKEAQLEVWRTQNRVSK